MIFQVARIFLLLFAIPAAFAIAAWLVYRRYQVVGLALLWAISSALYGFLSFRALCSRPVTCDVGSDPYSTEYLISVAPPFALAAAMAFGAVGVLVILRSRRAPGAPPRFSDLAVATLAGVAAFVVVAPILRAPVW